jgi:NAD(P)-dependent dehydrogenase (short-subunit alcohol dehydrogenase family)
MTLSRDEVDGVISVLGDPCGLAGDLAGHLRRAGSIVDLGESLDTARAGGLSAIVVAPSSATTAWSRPPIDTNPEIGPALDDAVRLVTTAFQVLGSQGHGRLVIVAPGPAFPVPGAAPLTVVSHALLGLARSLGRGSESGAVRVNAVAPIIDGPELEQFFDAHPYLHRTRFTVDAVAPLVAYLAGERCNARGEVFTAGGGRVARVAAVTAAGILAPPRTEIEPDDVVGEIHSLHGWIEPRSVLDELLLVEV